MPREMRIDNRFESWRDAARRLLVADIPPAEVVWNDGTEGAATLFAPLEVGELKIGHESPHVPGAFISQASYVACHRDSARWGLLYRSLWRLTHGEPGLFEIASDDDVRAFENMYHAVRRDRHKMTAFVRFRRVEVAGKLAASEVAVEHFVAWHRPDHYIVRLTAPFFKDRFASLRWTILTPDESVAWDGDQLSFGPGVPASEAPQADELEKLWTTYYGSIFNPARIKIKAMKREMAVRHWPTLPETRMIDDLLREAPARVEEMVKRTAHMAATPPRAGAGQAKDSACASTGSARDFLPERMSLPQLASAAAGCRGCDIYCNATQVVFGEGSPDALVMFVGEQPGDQEDLAGKPFVGPSGQLLDEVLEQVGIDRRRDVYVTNAVKHFKFEPRGKRRIHSKPNAREMAACRPWLEAELQVIKPRMVVCLGATAAQSLLGAAFRITKHRGEVMRDQPWAPWMLATFHPSALLRMPDEDARQAARKDFEHDLQVVARQIVLEKKAG